MNSFSEFIYMGGYAAYVWPAFSLAAIVLITNIIAPHRRYARLAREIAARARREQGRTRA